VLIANFITLATGGEAGATTGLAISQPGLLGIYAGVLVLLGLVNTVTVRALGIVGEISGELWCNGGGTAGAWGAERPHRPGWPHCRE
jgi:hypothetical protein